MLLKYIKICGLLSFLDAELEMRPLNVLVGPNASGKSNFIEVMALLQALPRDMAAFFRGSGGVTSWTWKGEGQISPSYSTCSVETTLQHKPNLDQLRYRLVLEALGQQWNVFREELEVVTPSGQDQIEPTTLFQLMDGAGGLTVKHSPDSTHPPGYNFINKGDLTPGQSVLRERRDPALYPEMHFLTQQFDSIRMYRDWNMGRNSAIRRPQPTDASIDYLYEDFSNLAMVLNRLKRESVMPAIEDQLGRFYETYESLGVDIFANTAQLWIREKGLANPVPVNRLSDGTLRFLALLSILCHPEPPPLICIEEPELGLHPDVIHQVAKLLIEASQRTQIIVTTHSSELIDHLWEDPESVVICERYPDTGTEFTRLNKDELKDWLERYRLGELWLTGELGGTRF